MYSEHGFEALIRAVFFEVCQRLTVVSYCIPGSTHCQVASAILRRMSRASKPFMKLSGPDAVPPPLRPSFDERSGERLVPVPDPHLKSMPSVLARVRMESSESCTALMKHAEHCG